MQIRFEFGVTISQAILRDPKKGCVMAEITARQAADYFIAFSREAGDPLTNLKLQKLLYYAQGWYLALYGRPLFDERIEAWPHGPVVPPVYGQFKGWGWEPIGGEIRKPFLHIRVKKHLDEIMNVFGIYPAYALERMTHREPPWQDARGGIPLDQPSHAIITHDSMRRYFRQLAKQKQ